MAQVTISPVSYSDNPALWSELLRDDSLQYPFGTPLDQEYMRAYLPHLLFRDISLIALASDRPIAGIQVTAHALPDGRQQIDFYGRPIFLRRGREAATEIIEKAERMLAQEFLRLLESLNFPSFHYLETCSLGRLSDFAICLLRSGCPGAPVYKQMIDLRISEENLRKGIRKSYRSCINWGEKNLTITVHDSQNTDPEIIEEFRQLHIAAAGRETRSPETWHLQYRQIIEKEAFLITGRLEGQLVTAALFNHSPFYCCYAVGASIRELFDKPLSHGVLWRSILEARERGCSIYEMGDLADLHVEGYSEKEKNIAIFKRGFGGAAFVQLRIGVMTVRL